MPVQAWFSNDVVAVEPGSSVTMPLTLDNVGDERVAVTIVPAGLRSNWMQVANDEVAVEPGEMRTVGVTVTPPALPSTDPGPATIAVRVIPVDGSDDIAAESTVEVLEFDDRRVVPLQPVQRARRRATYELMVENHGNGVATCRLRLIDVTNRIDGTFDPPAVGVAPGEASLVRLRSHARGVHFRRTDHHLEFDVQAEQPGHAAALATVSLVQPPTIPTRSLIWLGALAALLLGLVAAWSWVVRPAIDDAATEAVDEQARALVDRALAADATASATPASVPAAPTTVDDPATTRPPDGEAGEPDFYRLKVRAPLTKTRDKSFTIPDGQRFDMTDVRVENPFDDRGVATLLVNGKEMFVWSLQNVRGSQFEPTITQKRLQPGDNVTFSVRCDAVGDPFRNTCSNAVNVGGLVIDLAADA